MEGLRAMDGLEQFRPQALRFLPLPMVSPSAALVKIKSQQPEEYDCEPHSNAQQDGLTAKVRYGRYIIAILHIAAATGLAQIPTGCKAGEAPTAERVIASAPPLWY
jgi:hypothetical protein